MPHGWLALAAVLAGTADPSVVRPERPVVESIEVRRAIVTVRLDAKGWAAPGACDALDPEGLEATIDGKAARVVAVDRLPRPRMHWLLVDTSGSTNDLGQRRQAKHEAVRYAREVLVPGRDEAAVLTVDEDLHLVAGPTDDPEVVARAIDALPPGAQSMLTDAIDEVLGQIDGDRREHVVVFWSDGYDGLSLQTIQALRRRLAAVPNARVFPVAMQPNAGGGSRTPPALLFELADASGGRVLLSADKKWLDVLRGAVHRRWRVAVAIPSGMVDDAKPRLRGRVPGCEPVVIPDAWAGGAPAPELPPSAWVREHRRQRQRADDAACAKAGVQAFAAQGGIAGCALDVMQEQGILYDRAISWKAEILSPVRLARRRYYVPAPDPGTLPSEPWRILEALEQYPVPDAPTDDDMVPPPSRHPLLVHGRAFLTLQGTIARALWETQPSWKAFAKLRLGAQAEADIRDVAEELREQAPSLSGAEALAAAEASPLGRLARAAVERPADSDLRGTLAAWLGDIAARDLFLDWERAMIDRRLAGEGGWEEFESRWRSLRRWFALPEHARTIVPLVPCRDPRRDVVGFWRVYPPRAFWIAQRREGAKDADPIPYDHVPPAPLAWWLLERLPRTRPDLAARVSRGGWRVAELDYAPAGKLWKEDPEHPYSSADLLLMLESGTERLTLRARIDEGKAGPMLVSLHSN